MDGHGWTLVREEGLHYQERIRKYPFCIMLSNYICKSWSDNIPSPGINLSGKGYSEATTEDTAGSSYQEYSIEGVEVETKTNFYDAYPSEPWTLVTQLLWVSCFAQCFCDLLDPLAWAKTPRILDLRRPNA